MKEYFITGVILILPLLYLMNYSFLLFSLALVCVVYLKTSHFLYRVFVEKKEESLRMKVINLIEQGIKQINLGKSLLQPGNERVLIKIYVWTVMGQFFISLLPPMMLALVLFAFFQFKALIRQNFPSILESIQQMTSESIEWMLKHVPKHN